MSLEAYVHLNMVEQGIAEIEFYHPAHNSLPGNILDQLANTITKAGADDEVEVIILKSGGNRTFCAGASFNELIAINNETEGKAFFMGFAKVINACRQCEKIIIGRVQGKAVGGGVGVAAATDYCMATQYAAVKLSELVVGIGPFVVGPAVERKVGKAAFVELTLNANAFKPADWAKAKGLYAEVFDNVDELDKRVLQFAKELCERNPEARTGVKKIFWEGTEHWGEFLAERAAVSGKLVLSEFTKQALQKFSKA